MTSIDFALGRSAAPLPRMAWAIGLAAAAAFSVGTLFLSSAQQQLAWGGLAAVAFAAIPLLWREGYTWVILWMAPITTVGHLPLQTVWVAKLGLVFIAVGIAWSKRRLATRGSAAFDQAPAWAALVMLLWLWIRGATSYIPDQGIWEALRFAAVAGLVYMWLSERPAPGQRRRYFYAWLGVAALVLGVTLYEGVVQGRLRSNGTFHNANMLAQFLMLTVATVGAAALWAPQRWPRWVARVGLIPLFYGLYLTGSRAAWLATGVTILALLVAARAWRTLLLGAALLATLLAAYLQHPVVRYATNTVLRVEMGLSHRDLIWTTADRAFLQSPVVGHGLGATGNAMERFARYPTHIERILLSGVMREGHPHNFYREVLVTTGIIGLILAVLVILLTLRQAWRRLRGPDPWRRVYSLSLVGTIGGGLVHAYFERGIFLGYMSSSIFYWFLVAQTLRGDDPEFAEERAA